MKDNNKIINPLNDLNEKVTMPILKAAIKESCYEMPLWFKLYNQIRYYEEYGKLSIGFSVAGVDALAEQFDVTPKQIMKAFDNLTNVYKLGSWVVSEEPVFRRVKKVWVSNVRQKQGPVHELLKFRSTTPKLEEQTPPLSPPLLKNE